MRRSMDAYIPPSITFHKLCAQEAKLSIVRVLLPTGSSFLATLCPEAIPYDDVQKGVSHKKYLEIDSAFATELGIREQGMTVRECVCVCATTPPL